MNTSCSTRTIKYLMFSFNLLFVITGIVLIAVGASIHSNYNNYDTFLDGKYFSLPNLLIATGVLIFIISFLGCYGAFKESWLMLFAFSVLLGVIFIFEFSAGIAGYVLRDKTVSYLESKLKETIPSYAKTPSVTYMWDQIQEEFKCCGVNDPSDWTSSLNQGTALPVSCCAMVNGVIGNFTCHYDGKPSPETPTITPTPAPSNTSTDNSTETSVTTTLTDPTSVPTTESASSSTSIPTTEQSSDFTSESTTELSSSSSSITTSESTLETTTERTPTVNQTKKLLKQDSVITTAITTKPYDHGCLDVFGTWVKKHAVHIGVVGFIFAVIQIAGIGFACYLSRQLKNRYYST